MSRFGAVEFKDGASVDAFGRARVSNTAALFVNQNQYDKSPLFWEEVLTGTGTSTHRPDESSVVMNVAASGDKVVRQTRRYYRYQPGKSQLVTLTVVPDPSGSTENIRRRFGLFDDQNGIYCELDSSGIINLVRRTYASGSVVNNSVAQSAWNVDKLNGSGASKKTLDFTKSQIFFMDLQWLGVGRVRCGFVIDGHRIYCHEFLNTNVLSEVYMTTANLPVRWEIEALGAPTGTANLKAICAAIDSEGGFDSSFGVTFSTNNGVTTRSVSARTAILSIRPKATFNSITNRGQIVPEAFSLYTDGGGLVELVYGATIGGTPSWTSVNASSIVERDVAGTTVTGGIPLESIYVTGSTPASATVTLSERIASVLPITLDISGATPINLSIVYTPFTGSDSVAATLQWREAR